jgi:hypothetical protein
MMSAAPARAQHSPGLAEELRPGQEVKGALDGHHLVHRSVCQGDLGRRAVAQIDALVQPERTDALLCHRHLGGGDVEADDALRLQPLRPQDVLIAETKADIQYGIAGTHARRFRDQHRQRGAGVVQVDRVAPIAEVQIEALLAGQAGRDQVIDAAGIEAMKRVVDPVQVAEMLAPATPGLGGIGHRCVLIADR